ncbi:MAG TPA: tetratricopeptide repeat protein [Thermoanaerobaculia bacterium]|jgi:tetratricopeptide (TPR) repeat protein|nr:tetratricopeptide repeat protein [Thermoanaerobaculia bacterium]
MCRRGADRKRLAAFALALLLLPMAVGTAGAAEVSSPQVTGVEMTAPVRQTLKQIEEQWLQWIVQNNREEANRAVDDLLETARQIGMHRLPDLSAGAVARAVQAARQKDFGRARWALEAAERFDPGRPETAFAESTVKGLQGDYGGAVAARLRAYPRMLSSPLERYLWCQDLLVWCVILLLVTGGLFLAVQMLTKGTALYQDLTGLFGRKLPRGAALVLAVLALVWPVVLPHGAIWLPLYWSVLLWGYASASERVVLVALWLLAGASPLVLDAQRQRIAVALSPPAQAMESLEEHRLYGSLFADLGVLRSVLPESVAVKHLLADVHRSLNQWDLARSLYRQVLEKEPENTAALLNLGAYSFLKGDFGAAIASFQKAAAVDPGNAAAQYNLSQAYSESYMFDEQKVALRKAQEIDLARVNSWMANSQQRVVTVSGGMARIPEIRRELLEGWGGGEARGAADLFRRGLALLVSLSFVLVAVALHLARRPLGYAERSAEAFPEGAFDRWGRILLPGVASAEIGEGGKSFLALLVPTALLMLPLLGTLGVRIPWRYDPGQLVSWILAILGLAFYLGARLRSELRGEV